MFLGPEVVWLRFSSPQPPPEEGELFAALGKESFRKSAGRLCFTA